MVLKQTLVPIICVHHNIICVHHNMSHVILTIQTVPKFGKHLGPFR